VKRNLELEPVINSVSIERVLPRTLKIRVTERQPVAQVNETRADAANGWVVTVFQLDASGMVMQPVDPRARVIPFAQLKDGPLPVINISGVDVSQLQPGRRVTQARLLAAVQLISAFNRSPMAGRSALRGIDVSSPGIIVVRAASGGEITFGTQNFEQQLRRWREIYDLAQSRNKVIVSLDLAVANNVPLRWTETLARPPVAPRDAVPGPARG